MGYRDDKIKVLEMICAKALPIELDSEIQELSFTEHDFAREGLSYNGAIMIFKELFDADFMHSFKATTSPDKIMFC